MSATFEIYKYVGKDCGFGELVSSIGIKRIDQVVPAVYGNPLVPGDDKSDVNTYCVYRPDDENDTAYSFESVFKLKLKTPPDNQLSNIRIYPATSQPSDANIPTLMIGSKVGYTRPTNTEGSVFIPSRGDQAYASIWSYSKESPFLVTVNGNRGQAVDEQIAETNYNITLRDIGFGNVIYLNGERQMAVPIVEGNSYTFVDTTEGAVTFTVFDQLSNLPITNPDIVVSVDGVGRRVVTVNATPALMASYPTGFKYGDISSVTIGGYIYVINLSVDPIETVQYNVRVETEPNGTKVYYLNDVKNPVLNFMENRLYQFNNASGDTDPIRFLDNSTSIQANHEHELVLEGVTVANGGTVNEVVLVNPSAVKVAGKTIKGYQSVFHACYGNKITNTNTSLVGNYNIDTVSGGIYNPMHAGETDYIYLQLKVPGTATVGQSVPEIVIEYDEN